MTEWQRGYRQAHSDATRKGIYLQEWQLQRLSEDFQRGYRTAQAEIEEAVEAAVLEAVWRVHERQY